MKIERFDSFQPNTTRQENFFSDIVTRIFAICKTDPSFLLKEDVQNIEKYEKVLKEKISKQDDLLERSKGIKDDILKRISSLEDRNIDTKTSLLERLGSEL